MILKVNLKSREWGPRFLTALKKSLLTFIIIIKFDSFQISQDTQRHGVRNNIKVVIIIIYMRADHWSNIFTSLILIGIFRISAYAPKKI